MSKWPGTLSALIPGCPLGTDVAIANSKGSFRPDPEIRVQPDGAVPAPSQHSDVYLLGDRERVVDLDAKVTHGAFDLRMAK